MINNNTYIIVLCIALSLLTQQRACSEDDVVSGFLQKIEVMPAWTSVNDNTIGQYGPIIDRLGEEFQKVSLMDARDIVKRFAARCERNIGPGEPLNGLSKLYVLLRYYFQVPEKVASREAMYFGDWNRFPDNDNDKEADLLWPLTVKNGRLSLGHGFQGYTGPGYNPIAEFEFFHSHFGLRSRSSKPK